MKLDSWQREILEWKGNFLLCTGRQVGKTTIMSIKAARKMIESPGSRIIVVSLTEDQAKLIITMTLDYLEKNYKSYFKGLKKQESRTQNKIVLNNKSSMIARPVGNTGDAVRGFTGEVLIIDEASRMPELAFESATPVLLTTKGEIWMCSTPAGKSGYFYKSYLNKDGRFRVFHISSEEVIVNRPINEEWTEERRAAAIRFLEDEKKTKTELQYGQEYLGLFLDDLRRFFTDEIIEKTCILTRPNKINENHKYYLGCDIARMGDDESTFEIIKDDGSKIFKHVENQITKKTFTYETENNILNYAKTWKCKKVGIDAGAGTLGVSILDHLLQTEIKHKVIPLNNRKIVMDDNGESMQRLLQEDLYNNMLSMLEHGELLLLNDPEVLMSLKSVQFEFVNSPNNKTKVRIFGNYTHVVEGLIRAAWLVKKEQSLNLWAR